MKAKNNARINAKQRKPGGVTGKGFRPGKSGNPKGRPRTRGLLTALRATLGEVRKDGRTIEQALVDALIGQAFRGRSKLSALQTIFDRLEGRPKMQLDFNDVTAAMKNRTAGELLHYAETGFWPEDKHA